MKNQNPTEIYFLSLCRIISLALRKTLAEKLAKTGFVGDTNNSKDIKSTHKVDQMANRIIKGFLKGEGCNIFLEGCQPIIKKRARFSVFIDPIDGSLNFDRGVGDPCLVIAISRKTQDVTFGDLSFAYVESLRSGDRYCLKEGSVCFYNNFAKKEFLIKPRRKDINLSEATIYLRLGYGGAGKQLKKGLPILLECRDARSMDNTGMELCEIARDAAHILIEGREKSDHSNLFAYPILRAAGGLITDLKGNDVGSTIIRLDGKLDFVACSSPALLDKVFRVMRGFKKSGASITIKPSL